MKNTSKRHIDVSKFINLVLSVFMLVTCIHFTNVKANEVESSDVATEVTETVNVEETSGDSVEGSDTQESEIEETKEDEAPDTEDTKEETTDETKTEEVSNSVDNENVEENNVVSNDVIENQTQDTDLNVADEADIITGNSSEEEVLTGTDTDFKSATILYHIEIDGSTGTGEADIRLNSYSETLTSSDSTATANYVKKEHEYYQFLGWYVKNTADEWDKIQDDSYFTPTTPTNGWTSGATYEYYARFTYKQEYMQTITVEAYWVGDEGNANAKPIASSTVAGTYKIGGRDVEINPDNYFSDYYYGYQLVAKSDKRRDSVKHQVLEGASKNIVKFYIYRKYVVLAPKAQADMKYTGSTITVDPGYISFLPGDQTKTDLGLTFKGLSATGSGTDVGKYPITITSTTGGDIDYVAIDTTDKYVVNTRKTSYFYIVSDFPDFKFSSDGYGGSFPYTGSAITGIPVATTVEGSTIKFRSSTDNGTTWSSWTTTQPSRTDQGTTLVQVEATNPNYEGVTLKTEYTLTVTGKDIATAIVTIGGVSYNGSNQYALPTVMMTSSSGSFFPNFLHKDVDYTLSYSGDTKNVGTVTVIITGIGNYTGTTTATYKINPRTITLVSGSAEKEYDGTPLTNDSVTYADGNQNKFVDGEYPEITVTGTITDVVKDENGNDTSVDNTFTVSETAGSSYKESNYTITKQFGTLKVTHIGTNIHITLRGNYDTYEYDGKPHTISGYTVLEVTGEKKDLYDVKKNIEYTGDLSKDSYVDVDPSGKSYLVYLQTSDFKNISNNFGNVSFTVSHGEVTITPRKYYVSTDSATKEYDGKALTASGSVEGLAEGDTATITVTGSQTEIGSSKNTYTDFAFTGDTKATNYVHGEDSIGTLTVVKPEPSPSPSVSPTPTSTPTPTVTPTVEPTTSPTVAPTATPTATAETKKSTTKKSSGWDDGSPFTTDSCGNVFDRWGNKIYEAKGCNVGGYNLVRTSVED